MHRARASCEDEEGGRALKGLERSGLSEREKERERTGRGASEQVGLEEDQKHPEQKNKMRTLCRAGFISVPSSRVHELSMRRGTSRPDTVRAKKEHASPLKVL